MLQEMLGEMNLRELRNFCGEIAGRLRSFPDAEDLVSHAISKGIEDEVNGKKVRKPKSWLYRAARNEGLNRQRHKTVVAEYEETTASRPASYQPAADTEALREEACEQVRKVWEGLPPDQANVIRLHLAGHHLRQIAAWLSLKVSDVKRLLTAGFDALATALRRYFLE